MIFSTKVASTSQQPTFSPADQPSLSRRAAVKMPAGQGKAAAAVVTRAVAAAAPAPHFPAPARPAGAGNNKLCLPVSQTMSRLKAQGKVRAHSIVACMHVDCSFGLRVRILIDEL
jgi:indole-3-glycerol-phosphate lyase